MQADDDIGISGNSKPSGESRILTYLVFLPDLYFETNHLTVSCSRQATAVIENWHATALPNQTNPTNELINVTNGIVM